jgi:hypothetical protein
VLHDLLLQFLLLPFQVIQLVSEDFLLAVVVLLVLERMRQEFVVLGEKLRHVIHERPSVGVERLVHLQEHLWGGKQESQNKPKENKAETHVALLLRLRQLNLQPRHVVKSIVHLARLLRRLDLQLAVLRPDQPVLVLDVLVFVLQALTGGEEIAEIVFEFRVLGAEVGETG